MVDDESSKGYQITLALWCDLEDLPAHKRKPNRQRKKPIADVWVYLDKATNELEFSGIGNDPRSHQSYKKALKLARSMVRTKNDGADTLEERGREFMEFVRTRCQTQPVKATREIDPGNFEDNRMEAICLQCGYAWVIDFGNERVKRLIERRARGIITQQQKAEKPRKTVRFKIRCSDLLGAQLDVKAIKSEYPEGDYPDEILARHQLMPWLLRCR